MQIVWAGTGPTASRIELPAADEEAVPGVPWGRPDALGTPAYWAVRSRWDGAVPSYSGDGSTLIEQIGFCLLGGFGIRYEVASAAFARLALAGVFDLETLFDVDAIRGLLAAPLDVGGRAVRYRFPNQRAARVEAMRERFRRDELASLDALRLRGALTSFEGIGPKTASWIVRNHFDSDEVAIVDVHVVRACVAMGLFAPTARLPRDYPALEAAFLALATAIDVRAAVLDAVMWSEVRTWPRCAATRRSDGAAEHAHSLDHRTGEGSSAPV